MNPDALALLDSLERLDRAAGDPWLRVRGLLEKHAETEFGRAHGFDSIGSPEDFRAAIPPMNYDDYRSWIQRAAAGGRGILACDEPFGFERTSGTSSLPKWIPMTEGLREEFARGMASWFDGWRKRCPAVFEGKAYWTTSPPGMAPETTAGGLPVGMDSDAAYFPEEIGDRLSRWLVVPRLSGDSASVFDETAEKLLQTPDLSLISVWSPTFLLGIDAALQRLGGRRCWNEWWPKLTLVSCWADASSAPWIPLVRERLGGIPIEPKGLLATEGITSLPDAGDGSSRLAVECHIHEFLDESGCYTALHKLKTEQNYEVLLTTGGGLFRYRSGDRVQVAKLGADGLPRLRFMGRSGAVSDLVGEKLHEQQVVEALLIANCRGFMVADPTRPGYDLWLEDTGQAARFEAVLRQSSYFDQALAIKQLAPIRARELPENWSEKLAAALANLRGIRLGDAKLPVLISDKTTAEVASWLG